MKKAAFIPLTAILLLVAVVACNKTKLPAPAAPSPSGSSVSNHGAHKQIPKAWDVAFGKTKECFYGSGGCYISTFIQRQLSGNEAVADGDITSDGHLLLIVDLSTVDAAIVNDLISTEHFDFDHDVLLPQDGVDAVCDGQTPSVPHWGGPVSIQAANYPLTVTNGGADGVLEMEGAYDPAADTWSWSFRMH